MTVIYRILKRIKNIQYGRSFLRTFTILQTSEMVLNELSSMSFELTNSQFYERFPISQRPMVICKYYGSKYLKKYPALKMYIKIVEVVVVWWRHQLKDSDTIMKVVLPPGIAFLKLFVLPVKATLPFLQLI